MDSITCTACRIQFTIQDEGRAHYKSEFHTYNLKRKYVNLEPVSKEVYQKKLQESQFLSSQLEKTFKCECCNQNFPSQKTLNRHVRSKQSVQGTQEVDAVVTCLFCNFVSENVPMNLKHMLENHGFFVPDFEFVKDMGKLLEYLSKKVRELMVCLYCNNRQGHNFKSPQSVQQHMIDKQHCFLNTDEDEAEFKEFYGAESDNSYDIISSEDEIRLDHYIDLGSQSSETCSLTLLSSQNLKIPAEILKTGELKLENGKILGNKYFAKYYRQFYRPVPQRIQSLQALAEERPKTEDKTIQNLNETEFSNECQANSLKIGMKNNMLQHYFRSQV